MDEYLPGKFHGIHDVRVTDRAHTLCVATWLHCLDLTSTYGKATSASLKADRYHMGPLLEYFLAPRTSNLTFEEVVQMVLVENRCEAEESLEDLQQC